MELEGLNQVTSENKQGKKAQRRGVEEPFLQVSQEMLKTLDGIKQSFGISDDFPFHQLMARSEKSPKMYFLSPAVKQVLDNDERGILQVVNTGVKMFIRHTPKEQEPTYRLSQEGLQWLSPYITKRKIHITEREFFILLDNKDPFINNFAMATQNALDAVNQGSLVFILPPDCKNEGWSDMVVSGWKGKVSCKLLIPKMEINALRQLGKRNFGQQVKKEVTIQKSIESMESLDSNK